MQESAQNLLPRLRAPEFTRVLIVTLPEATPFHQAAQLQRDLRRAEIEPSTWVINQSLSLLNVMDPLLIDRQRNEAHYINEVVSQQAIRTALISWHIEPPVGQAALTCHPCWTSSLNSPCLKYVVCRNEARMKT